MRHDTVKHSGAFMWLFTLNAIKSITARSPLKSIRFAKSLKLAIRLGVDQEKKASRLRLANSRLCVGRLRDEYRAVQL